MTTTLQAHGGGARPASIDTSGKVAGGTALRVYGFDSAADALAAGYVCEGGPAVPVALITDAQIASGEWRVEGDPSALVVYTAAAGAIVEGGSAVPVYSVNGWGSAAPAPVAPLFDSAEVGTVDASTVAVTFDQDVSASDYSAGVTIKVNGAATSITSATRQSNHAIVYYVIPVLWHGSGDVVTWEYEQASGNIVAESGSTPLGDVTAQGITNNCEYAALVDLQADTLALNDGDPVSTWADQSGNSRDFTQTGDARPTKQTAGGYPVVRLDGVDDWMLGPSFADNLDSMTIISALRAWDGLTASKIGNDWCSDPGSTGWSLWRAGIYLITDTDNLTYQSTLTTPSSETPIVFTAEVISKAELHSYINGVNDDQYPSGGNVEGLGVSSYSSAEPVRLCADGLLPGGGCDSPADGDICCFVIYAPAPSATNRAALEIRLAARYGVTL